MFNNTSNLGAFTGSRFFSSPSSSSSSSSPSVMSPFEPATTPPSTSATAAAAGYHQKLDLLIATTRDQQTSIHTLRDENLQLKQQLRAMQEDLKSIKESESNRSKGRTIKLPTNICVSNLIVMLYL